MRRVKNGKVIQRIADKTRKAGKTRNLIAVLAIALTALLFTSFFTIGGSLVEKQQKETMRQVGGSAHAGYKYLTQEEYDTVKKDKKIKEISYRIAVGDAVNDSLKKLHTEISYYEDLDAKMSFCYPETGHMPERKNEIVTSDLVLKAMGLPCELGTEVPVKLNIGGEIREDTFILSGYFAGDTISMAQVMAVSKEYANEAAPTPTTSAMGMMISAEDYPGRIMADFNFATSFHLEKQMAELTKRCGFPEDADMGINWAYMGGDIDLETTVLVAVILLVIIISGYLIIYNIFYINVFHDIQHYGLLKTIGTTGKQLRKIVRRQAYMLSLYGIPLGLLCGAAVGKLLLPAIMSQLSFSSTADTEISLNIWIFAGAALFSFITVYISCIKPCRIASKVSPVEAVRYTEGQEDAGKKTKKKGKKTKKVTPRKMALQNIKRNKKKVVIVVASLSLALVLLNCVYSLISGFDMDKFVSNMAVSDFSVSDATLDNVSVRMGDRVLDGVTEDFLQELREQEGVEEIGNIYVKLLDPVFTDEDFALIKERIFDNPAAQEGLSYAGDEYMEYMKTEKCIDGKVYGMGKLAMEKLSDAEGDPDWEKFSTGKYVITTRFGNVEEGHGINYFQPGETVTIRNEEGESREYEVLAVADVPYPCGYQVFGLMECNYILPEGEFLDFMGNQQPMRILINVDAGHEEKMEKWMEDYCENINPDLLYTSKAKIVEQFDSAKNTYAMVGGLLVLILAVIGILNFINTMVTSILSRKQEFAMMEAVGMTGTQLRQMLCFEGGYFALFTGIAVLLISSLLNLTAVRSIGDAVFFFSWKFTVTPLLLCLPLLAVVVLVIPVMCYKNMCRSSVVERMRKAE